MAAAASKVEDAGARLAAHDGFDLVEIGPAAVNGAVHIGRRSRRIMGGDKIVLNVAHAVSPRLSGHFLPPLNLLQGGRLSWYKSSHHAAAP
jgi:hypothetical protein